MAMFEAAATVGLAWTLVRELDPDHPTVALLGAAAAGVAVVITGETSLAALTGFMLASRILVRSTGLNPLLTDIVAVGIFAGVFARTPLTWAAGIAVAVAVALDTSQPQPSTPHYMWLALAIGVAVTITAVLSGALDVMWMLPGLTTAGLGVAGLAAALTAPSDPVTRNDIGGPFEPSRVRAARVLVSLALVLGTLAGGATYAHDSWPAWIALVAAGASAHWRC